MDKKQRACRECGIRELENSRKRVRVHAHRSHAWRYPRARNRARVCRFNAGVSFISVRTQMRATKDQSHQRIPPTLGTHAAQHGHRGSLWLFKDHHRWGVAYWSVTCSSLTLPCTLRFRVTDCSGKINWRMCRSLGEKNEEKYYLSLWSSWAPFQRIFYDLFIFNQFIFWNT